MSAIFQQYSTNIREELNRLATHSHLVDETDLTFEVVQSDISSTDGADQVTNMVSLTQAEYDAIGTPDASTFYVIVG